MNQRGKAGVYILLLAIGVLLGAIAGAEVVRLIVLRGQVPGGGGQRTEQSGLQNDIAAGRSVDMYDSRRNAIVISTQKVAPCVVGIVVTQLQVVGPAYYNDFFDLFFGPKMLPRYQEVENMGSGVIIDRKGTILTNNHVVGNAQKLLVNFPDGRQVEGRIVGRDAYSDIAVVSVAGDDFNYATFGNSDDMLIGEWVIAIGNPFLNFFNDPRPTVTVGVVSAVNRNFAPSEDVYYQGMIQTDAAINPGNSGGPLVNAKGEVIGINTFIYTGSKQSKTSIGIGFAIPANRAKRVADELIKYGHRRQVWTGITVQDLDRSIALTLGLDNINGVVVTDVAVGSPGEHAGLRQGDVITGMGDRAVKVHSDLDGFFLDYFVGDTVHVSYVRKGHKMTCDLMLREYTQRR